MMVLLVDNKPNCRLEIDDCGNKRWYKGAVLHREDGPAVELRIDDGIRRAWYLDGQLHRTDGPAIEWEDGVREWYVHNTNLFCSSQEQFERLMRLKAFW